MKIVKIQTHANISLNKYWGKRDEKLFLPTKNSLTVSLSELTTTTFIQKIDSQQEDLITLNGNPATENHKQKIVDFLNLFRKKFNIQSHFSILTHNNFPTAAGLASSSSGFSALALGLNQICNLGLSKKELSILARQGSGSACRSIYGGFVLWHKGQRADGLDCYAEQIFDHNHWPELRIIVVVVENQQKFLSSREGMQMTVATSKSYQSWLEKSEQRLPKLINAITNKDFTTVGKLAQEDWADMQKTMLDTKPQLNYWTPTSNKVINKVKKFCENNIECYFTTEAGPNLKILCLENNQDIIKNEIAKIGGVMQLITCKIAANPYTKVLDLKKSERISYDQSRI